ncbi:sirohydrochlorin chelatase [Ornithinimicrobium sp. Y1694]|uniref:sirohydrochlorin chelatase n=1 Tax=Ornithinimicrobium sp. Y1694 TaxID=3418590 RepID=UPI003CEB97B9
MTPRLLVLAAHGTADPAGQAVVEQVAARVADVLGVPHQVGYVDVCGPTLAEVLAGPSDAGDDLDPAVVVPYFLATGYHVRHDVPTAVEQVDGVVVTPALGVEDEVVTALVDRVQEAWAESSTSPHEVGVDAVLLTAAGSSVDAAREEVARLADLLGERLGIPSSVAFLSGPGPRPEDELARLRAAGHARIVLATHLLAPGFFADRASAIAAEHGAVATDVVGSHQAIVDLLVRRYRQALP